MIAVESIEGRATIVDTLVQCRRSDNYVKHVGIRNF